MMKKFILVFVIGFGIFLNFPLHAQRSQNYEIEVNPFNINIVPKNAVRVPLMEIRIKAQKNISLSEIWLKRSGLSGNNDFGNIWAESNSFRTSLRTKVQFDDSVKIRFLRPINIKREQTETFSIYINLNSIGGGRTFNFSLEKIITSKISKYPKYSRNKFRKFSTSYFYKNKFYQKSRFYNYKRNHNKNNRYTMNK